MDGSGLSRENRVAASSFVRLIAAADADATWGAALISSLAQGGQGTLIHRFPTGAATRRVRAKTGYLNGVSAMAGRVVSRGGEHYAFALLMNTTDIPGRGRPRTGSSRCSPPEPRTLPAPRTSRRARSGGGALPSQDREEGLLVDHGHAERSGLLQLRAGVDPGDDEGGRLAHRPGHLAAGGDDRALGVVAREAPRARR